MDRLVATRGGPAASSAFRADLVAGAYQFESWPGAISAAVQVAERYADHGLGLSGRRDDPPEFLKSASRTPPTPGSVRLPVDTGGLLRDTGAVLGAGASRQHIAGDLKAAYAHGLLSEHTLGHRLDLLFDSCLVDPARLVGDLSCRLPRRSWRHKLGDAIDSTIGSLKRAAGTNLGDPRRILALDWSGSVHEMLLGRHASCDVVLSDMSVSRRHARLVFRDGHWVIQDLESTNGIEVNGVSVGRCELRPGDQVFLGDEVLLID